MQVSCGLAGVHAPEKHGRRIDVHQGPVTAAAVDRIDAILYPEAY